MALRDITAAAVLAAIGEFDELGRDAFLSKYGFSRARRYLLVHNGQRYDSKAIAGAAYGYLPGQAPLKANEFSGGEGHAVAVLRQLGFEVSDGDMIAGDIALDDIITTISSLRPALASGKPMLKQAVVLLWGIGRTCRNEDRLLPWPATTQVLVPLLETHRRKGERNQGRPDYPIAALFQAGLWDLHGHDGSVPTAHGDTTIRRWFDEHQPSSGLPQSVYDLAHRSGKARIRMVDAIVDRFFIDTDYSRLAADVGLYDDAIADDEPESKPKDLSGRDLTADYRYWCNLVIQREEHTYGKRRTGNSNDPIRLAAARRAVLLRSEGRCESPDCGMQAPDITDRGHPILEVDHIADLAGGGRDHPIQMIALCPNCHAVKTRGCTRHQLRPRLFQTAQERHTAWTSE